MYNDKSTPNKHYNIIIHTIPTQEKVNEYEIKIKNYQEKEPGDCLTTQELINLECIGDDIDIDFMKYLFFRHLNEIMIHITKKGIKLNLEHNINMMVGDFLNNNSSENLYENTIEEYKNYILYDEPTIHDIINVAIAKGNTNLLFYIYYREEKEINNHICNVVNN